MTKYQVNLTDEAQKDMEMIYEYIANQLSAPENAMSQYNRIADAIMRLDTFPKRYAIFDTEPECSWGLRHMYVDHYVVCFIVTSNKVTVTNVLYGGSDIHERLKDRLL